MSGAIGFVMIVALGLLQLALGFAGVDYLIGWWAAVTATVVAVAFRFMLPMTIGSYFGAVHVLGLPWWVGVLVVAPGLVFVIPGLVMGLYLDFKSRRRAV